MDSNRLDFSSFEWINTEENKFIMKMNKTLFTSFLCILLLAGCKKNIPTESNANAFTEYISVYPEKLVSVVPNLQFHLQKEITSSNVSDDAITVKPSVKGKVVVNNNIVSFVPDGKLESNKEYSVTLHLNKLYGNIAEELEDFTVLVKTKELFFNVSLSSPSVYNKDMYYVEGDLSSSDIINTTKLKELITANYGGTNKKITFDKTGDYATSVQFKIDSIQRGEQDNTLNISWNGKAINSSSKGNRDITITGKSNFKILDVEVFNAEKQHIEISFSDPIQKLQDLKGLIQFINTQKRKFTYQVNNNIVSLYPKSSFRDKVDIEIFKGVKNTEGYSLKNNYVKTLYFEQLKPEVNFIKSGTILPNSNNLKINFNSVNLRAVDVVVYKVFKDNVLQFLQNSNLNSNSDLRYVGRPQAKYTVNLANQGLNLSKPNAFAVDLADFVTVENGALYRVAFEFNKEYSYYSCDGEVAASVITYGKKEIDTKGYDSSRYYSRYPRGYSWRDRENPCTSSYYYDKTIRKNILASDIGAIVKKGNNGKAMVVATDILSAQPLNGAKVTLYNLQQQPIFSSVTNKDGIAKFDDTTGVFFAAVSNATSTTYVKINDGNSLSMSKFDVSGAKLQKGIKGYVYGERGVWRPGDQLFLTFVLNDKANPLPLQHPIKFELINPQGKVIDRKISYKNAQNVYPYSPQTAQDALTGDWRVNVSVGNAYFGKGLKIETIKPNRLKIKFGAIDEVLKSDSDIDGDIEVKWLHGAIARQLKYDINGKFSAIKTTFPKFSNYIFDDVTRRFSPETFKVTEGNLDSDGKATFSIPTKKGNRSLVPGMLKIGFVTKVYENGGDFSTDVFSTKYSPYSSYVGVNLPEEQDSSNYLFTDQDYTFNVASVNDEGKPIANNLEVKVYRLNWRWWWSSSDDGLSSYSGTTSRSTERTYNVKTNSNGKGSFNLKIEKNDWGRFLIKVRDKNSNHVTSSVVYYDWPSWYGKKRGSQDKTNATMLVFSSDKDAYKVNEKATIKFASSKGARALVTVENGTEVLDHFWVETKDKNTEFTFPVKENYAPNVFVNISLLQKHGQTENDLPIRMYGAIPLSVTDPASKLEPELQLADEIKPESTVSLRVKEKNAKAMTYTIAIVDEGLLDLTRFKTPNPWHSFYKRQSLGVKTWDIFDDVIGAYGGKINQILSIGGDEAEAGSKNKKANRFKPMVVYLGPFELASGAVKKHEIKIPNYVGSVRAMVVASNADTEAYGQTEKTAFVRKPVMVLASLPRKITPKETVTLPVTVFAMKPNVKNVKVSVEPHESFSIEGAKTQNISFDQPDEKMAYFTLKVNDYNGIGKVKINATSGSAKATYEVEIDVLNPNPVTTEVKDLVLKSNETGELNFTTFGTKGTNEASVEFSTLPPMNFTRRLSYLIQYPHGCIEQTTSSAFPQLYLTDIFELSNERSFSIQRNIKATIQRLSNFQLSNGGLSYWQGGTKANEWGTSYAGHFMLEAAKKGYVLPIGFKSKWITYQKKAARNWRNNSSYYNNAFTQAYRLYTLSLANTPDLASMNRLRETSGISNQAKLRLASAYALAGKKSISLSILKTLKPKRNYVRYYSNYGSKNRNKAMALETYSLLKDEVKAIKLAREIAEVLSSEQWMSTQTTSYCLLAMSGYALQNGTSAGITTDYALNSKAKVTKSTSKSLMLVDLKDINTSNGLKITNKNSGVVYVRLFNKGVLPVGEEKTIQKNLEVYVTYKSKDGDKIDPSTLTQGTNFVAEVSIGNTTDEKIDNIALTQFIPSGWEIINTRFTDFGNNTSSSSVDYTDIRDASVSNYFTLKQYGNKKFRILLNASYLGKYYLPGVQAEAMYDNNYIARTKGQWIEVVK